ncbi:MFS transporter [candidate division KSB1 bacterium]|nr:MFS transporter [candidate division KSB1 bacterium]
MEKLTIREKLGFSAGEYAGSVVWQALMYFLPIFYTDTFGLTAATVSTMFLVVRLFDAANDPIMGMIADRTQTRWGKFRPYLLWFCVPYGLGTVLMFTTPDFGATGKIIYAYATYTLMMMIYTAMMIPYNTLIGVISPDSRERTSVASYKFVFAYAAGASIQALVLPLVEKLGAGDQARGYTLTMAIFSMLCIMVIIIAFLSVKERVKPDPAQKSSLKQDLTDLTHNKPWLILAAVCVATLVYVAIRSSVIMYYFKYYIRDEKAAGPFMVAGTLAVMIGVLPTKWLSKKVGKKNLYIGSMIIVTLASAGFFMAGPDDLIWLYAMQIIFSLASGPSMPLLWSMLADAADYSEWKNHRRATGLVYSAATFSQKMGFSIGGALSMLVLSMFGYVAGVRQTAAALFGIRLSLSLIPAAIAVLAIIALLFYHLDDHQVAEIGKELAKRRLQKA